MPLNEDKFKYCIAVYRTFVSLKHHAQELPARSERRKMTGLCEKKTKNHSKRIRNSSTDTDEGGNIFSVDESPSFTDGRHGHGIRLQPMGEN